MKNVRCSSWKRCQCTYWDQKKTIGDNDGALSLNAYHPYKWYLTVWGLGRAQDTSNLTEGKEIRGEVLITSTCCRVLLPCDYLDWQFWCLGFWDAGNLRTFSWPDKTWALKKGACSSTLHEPWQRHWCLRALDLQGAYSMFDWINYMFTSWHFVCNTPISGCIKALPTTTARTKRYSKGGQRQLKTRAIIITQVTTLTIVQQT